MAQMIINANALQIPLADQSVHMICTSPPYWGLRNYGVDGQLGLERTPEEYIANMVAVFRECWRVLRNDGTMWVNCGDSYAGNPHYMGGAKGDGSLRSGYEKGESYKVCGDGLKPKDLVGIPWRLAFALQADGWYLRSDIIWSKPNPMPESVTDRPTKAHEYLFLLAKQERYYYDAEAIREEYQSNSFDRTNNPKDTYGTGKGGTIACNDRSVGATNPAGRNRRTVWTIPTAPYKGAHFATFPPALVEPCIKAGTSERGICPKCGKGWRRVVKKEFTAVSAGRGKISDQDNVDGWEGVPRGTNKVDTLGWQPACTCDAGEPIPALVFDPFVGSGTTVKVAYDLGRRGVGLDLSLNYLDEQARGRIHNGHTGRLL